jgi:hypothetical protein
MTRCDPDIWVHHDRSIEEDHIFSLLDEFSDPEIFDVLLQECAEWTVVPRVRETSVDLRSLVDEPFGFREGDEGRHFERHRREK